MAAFKVGPSWHAKHRLYAFKCGTRTKFKFGKVVSYLMKGRIRVGATLEEHECGEKAQN